MLDILRYGVILSFCAALIILSFSVIKTFNFNKKKLYSRPSGNSLKGIIYALGQGLAPWEKESAVRHLPTYLAGILYHTGVFAALLYLVSLLIPFRMGSLIIMILRLLILVGSLCGIGLFIKRSLKSHIRKISCPDDYVSNLLVDGFLIITFIDTYHGNMRGILFIAAIILALYIPLGKIRHCFYFFYSRILFGFFFGRRGVLPRKQRHSMTSHG